MLITVFTPTYNRANNLSCLYTSLLKQTYCDFEWLIVDDGSIDKTKLLVQNFISDNKIRLNYIYKENGGKHTAINRGVQEAKGELFMIVDSDDCLPPSSLSDVKKMYDTIKNKEDFAGIIGYMSHRNGKLIGKEPRLNNVNTNSIEIAYKYGITHDLMEVFRTSILKEFPFPEIKNERFCPENLVWFRIAQKYKLRIFKKIIYYRDYLAGGLTDRIISIRMNSPIASTIYYHELVQQNIRWKDKIKAAINYWRFYYCLKTNPDKTISQKWLWTKPLGYILHLRDQQKIKR